MHSTFDAWAKGYTPLFVFTTIRSAQMARTTDGQSLSAQLDLHHHTS
jgi:hypothetical protein